MTALWLPSGNEFNTSLSISWWTCVRIANISISTGASASSPEKSWAAATSPLTLVKTQLSSTRTCMSVLTGEHCYFCRWRTGYHCGSCQLNKFCQAKIPFSDKKVSCPVIPDISCAIALYVVSALFAYSILEVTWKKSISYLLHCKRDTWQLKFLKMCQLSITLHGHSAALCSSSLVGISMYLTSSYWLRTKLSIMLNKCSISLRQEDREVFQAYLRKQA